MMGRIAYILSTLGYGLFLVAGFLSLLYFLYMEDYFLSLIALLVTLVSSENFFCGKRHQAAGYKVKADYAFPPFLRGK